MSEPKSALEYSVQDVIREVSPEAISFYVDELSGIHLPEDFKKEHEGSFKVDYWKPEDRLRGKFGRFTVHRVEEGQKGDQLAGLVLMGSTLGVRGLDRDGYFHGLRHYDFNDTIRGNYQNIVEARGVSEGERVTIDAVDYGSTNITLDRRGVAETIEIGGYSGDYGRANEEGRQQTCDTFEGLLEGGIKVVNAAPTPDQLDRII